MIADQITLLNETVLECLNETDEIKIIKRFTDVGLKVLKADFGFAWLVPPTLQDFKLAYTSPTLPFTPKPPRKGGRNYTAIKSSVPNFVSETKKTPDARYVSKYVKSFVIIPLVYKQTVIGSMALCFKESESFSREKRVLSTFIGNSVAQAITIHRLVESEHNARVSSEKQKAHFKALIENSYEMIVHMSEAGEILYTSPSVKKVLGARAEQVVRKILRDSKLNQVTEFRHKNKNGTVLFLESISTALPGDLEFGGTVMNIWDITGRKELELAQEAERLLEEEKLKTESFADAAHELRTPLTIIKGNVDLALRGSPKDSKQSTKTLQAIDHEIKHLSNILSDLTLVTSKAEQLRGKVVYSKVNLSSLIQEAVKRCKVLAHQRRISLTTKEIPRLTLSGDAVYLEKMLVNLIKNSIMYGKPGGHTVITTQKSKASVTIHITDNGIGIAKEDLPHIFDRFYRGDKAHSSRGDSTGLGLAIVKWTVGVHGGTVSVKSIKDKGSVFSVSLPIRRSA